jgi:hypothetical protein
LHYEEVTSYVQSLHRDQITPLKLLLLTSLFLLTRTVQAQPSSYSEVLDRFHSEMQFNGVVLVATNGTIDFLM